jgi:hypothetical protein
MDVQGKTETLLEAIERRLSDISERQHALAVEKAWLVEQTTPLRHGVTSPDLALALLKRRGSRCAGWRRRGQSTGAPKRWSCGRSLRSGPTSPRCQQLAPKRLDLIIESTG